MSDNKPKIGEGHAGAMFRLGLREVRSTLYPESNVAQPSEYGLYGTRTPGEVAAERRGDERDMEEEQMQSPTVADRVQWAKERSEECQPSEDRELERD